MYDTVLTLDTPAAKSLLIMHVFLSEFVRDIFVDALGANDINQRRYGLLALHGSGTDEQPG